MQKALMIAAVAGCLMAQRTPARPAEESYDIRIARLETTVPQMQKQLDEINGHLKDIDRNVGDIQRQLAELNTRMNFVMWIGGVMGAYLILNTFKPLFEKPGPPPAAPVPVYPRPVIYGSYPQPGGRRRSLGQKAAGRRGNEEPPTTP